MQNRLLLFDIDGTLMLSGGAGMRAMHLTAAEMFGEQFSWDGIDPSGKLDPAIFAEAVALNGMNDAEQHLEQFRNRYLELLQEQLRQGRQNVRIMPGILQLIESLRCREVHAGDVTLGLLTGNYAEAVPIKLAAIELETSWFTVTAFGDEAPTRSALVQLAIRRFEQQTGHQPDPRSVIVIGDTPRDIRCAHANRCIAFTVATGNHSVDQLRQAGADYTVENLADPQPLLSLL